MTLDTAGLVARIELLESKARRARTLVLTTGIAVMVAWVSAAAWRRPSQIQDTVRTKLLIIEDAAGRDRIVLGAPMPDGREYAGMKILNQDGAEQFGLGLKTDGSISMGFDTRPGVGNPANTERLNMGVTATGQGWIRYLDNGTRARLRLGLDSADTPSIQFLNWPDDKNITVRAIRFSRDTTFVIGR
jgi:hypothetical protein